MLSAIVVTAFVGVGIGVPTLILGALSRSLRRRTEQASARRTDKPMSDKRRRAVAALERLHPLGFTAREQDDSWHRAEEELDALTAYVVDTVTAEKGRADG